MLGSIRFCCKYKNQVRGKFIHFFFEDVYKWSSEVMDVGWKTAGVFGFPELLVKSEFYKL